MNRRQLHAVAVIILGILAWGYSQYQVARTSPQPLPQPSIIDQATRLPPAVSASSTRILTNAVVTRVVDGDTIEARLDGQSDSSKIRLLGINTPESVDPRRAVQCFGKEASAFAKQLMEGKRITLKEDVQADDHDKYGRLLRNVLLEDGTDVNALLVKEGYAYAYISFPLNKQRKTEMRSLEQEARTAKRGLWSPETCDGMK